MPFAPQAMLGSFHTTATGGGAPALPTLTSSGQTPIFRFYADTPAGHLYQDDALTIPSVVNGTGGTNAVLGIKDLSAAHNDIANTVTGHGAVLASPFMNSKAVIGVDGANTVLESDNATNINILRTASNVTLMTTFEPLVINANPPIFVMASLKSKTTGQMDDCFILRFSSTGDALYGGRFGSDGGASFPLYIASTTLDASWSDLYNKKIKMVMRAAPGSGNIQKLDIVASDGTITSSVHSISYTNGTGDTDGASTPWDYLTLGGFYYGGNPLNVMAAYWAEAAMWMGTSQMNDADVVSLLTYAAGTAGF